MQRSIRASEAERTRWARELHDETLQELGGLRVLLSAARRSDDRARVDQALDQAVDLVTSGIANLRALITDLRPAALDEIGVHAALSALVERVRAVSGLTVEFDLDLDLDSDAGHADARHVPELEETVYRVVQEALTNAVKHADATEVRVVVRESEDHLHVTVHDDGLGFEPEAQSAGYGLVGMNERITLAEGTLAIRTEPGQGTAIEVELPVRRRSSAEAQASDAGEV
jgi:signal transduction histidine kinase